jgi:hypothetical protein
MTLLDLGALTVETYRIRTGDATSEASAVSGALVDAERLLGEELRRELALEERAERMIIHFDGVMYPKAWPVTACATNVIDGRMLRGGTPDLDQFLAMIGVSLTATPRATVTYTGGFDATTLPITLRDALYDLASGTLYSRAPVLVGAGSASVGDVSVSVTDPGEAGVDAYVPGISKRVARYRNRFV